jgi:hydrogenase expression/formation protein HypE
MPSPGKEGRDFMERVVYAHLGAQSSRLRVGPGRGLDNGVVDLGDRKELVMTADPISAIPAFGMELSARLSVHLIASDFTTSGFDPEYAAFSYNFPPAMPESERGRYIGAIGDECRKLGVAIAAGHTGSYPGGGYTVIGTGVMFGIVPQGRYITPAMAQAGDHILMTKEAAIEAAGTLALCFPRFVAKEVGAAGAGRAKALLRSCSTVRDARAAREAGIGKERVTSMHDATEGGVLGALEEMASAAGKSFEVELERIPTTADAKHVCAAFGLDPLRTMGEGALLITCAPEKVEEVEGLMVREGIPVARIGEVKKGDGLSLKSKDGRTRRFEPGPDRYWGAFELATRRRLT